MGGMGLLAVAYGWNGDNETEAENFAKAAGKPGPINPDSKVATPPPQPKNMEEYAKQQQSLNTYGQGSGYPGASKKI